MMSGQTLVYDVAGEYNCFRFCFLRGPGMVFKGDEAVRVLRVRQLFEVRSSKERTEAGVLLFYAWFEKHYPHLLPSGPGDKYEHLKIDLTGLIE